MYDLRVRRGPEGRRLNVSPARKGWVSREMMPSTVDAALSHAATNLAFSRPYGTRYRDGRSRIFPSELFPSQSFSDSTRHSRIFTAISPEGTGQSVARHGSAGSDVHPNRVPEGRPREKFLCPEKIGKSNVADTPRAVPVMNRDCPRVRETLDYAWTATAPFSAALDIVAAGTPSLP
jgi:hypothetical protein